ncbi:MAG: YIP1 family protein [Elusimicrobia bacterium]|nr:YIP1 family protein [Elusimicrobiota bacterium]
MSLPPPSQPPRPADDEQFSPGLLEFMEGSLRAAFTPNPVFEAYRDRGLPSFGTMTLNLLFWSAVAAVINIMMVYNNLPAAANLGTLPVVFAFAGTMAAALAGSFVLGGMIHLLTLLSGGEGPYDRSYELLSLLSSLAPLASAAIWVPVPFLWLLPTLYGTYLLIRGVAVMQNAPETQACVVVGTLGVLLAAGQLLAHRTATRFQRQFEMWANLSSTGPEKGARASSARPVSPADGWQTVQPQDPNARSPWPQGYADDQALARQSQSGVDMVRASNQGSGLPMLQPGQMPTLQQAQQMQEAGMNMLDNVSRQLQNNSTLTKSMNPQQQQQMKELMTLVDQVRSQARNPAGPNVADPQEMIRKVMQMMNTLQHQQGQPQMEPNGSNQRNPGRRPAPRKRPTKPLPPDEQ